MSLRIGDEFGRVLTAAQAGEEWAVASIYRAMQPALLRYLVARDQYDAEDIAAQVWLEVARGLSKFSGGEDELRAYVFTIAHRRLLNTRRSRARRRLDPVDEAYLASIAGLDDPAAETEARVTARAAVGRISSLLRPEQAEVVLLRVVGDMSVEQVAAVIGKSPAAVRVMQHRALRRLAEQLRRFDEKM